MMNRLAGSLVGMVGLALAVFSGGALAATECNTGPSFPLGNNTPLSGTLVGGVVVNAGDFCSLVGANVSGGVQVNEGGILILCGSTINGGVITNGAAQLLFGAEEVLCDGDVINGPVQILNTGPGAFGPPAPSIAVENSVIRGVVHFSGNQGPIAVANDMIAGNLLCNNNLFDLNPELDMGNLPPVVTGVLRCKFLGDE